MYPRSAHRAIIPIMRNTAIANPSATPKADAGWAINVNKTRRGIVSTNNSILNLKVSQ